MTDRESAANPLQPAILSNGTMGTWITRLSDDHGVTRLALESATPDAFVESLFERILTRRPTAAEKTRYAAHLTIGFADRRLSPVARPVVFPRKPAYYVSWSNHLNDMATTVRMQQEAAARRGDPATEHLSPEWRRRAEDVLWALVNSPEFLYR